MVVLAVSDEEPEKVAEYVEDLGITVRVAAGFKREGAFTSGKGIPNSYLIDAEGKVLWTGHPSSLNAGKIKAALKGVKKSSNSYMAFSPRGEFTEKSVSKLAEKAMSAKMGKALKGAMDLAAAEEDSAERIQAKALVTEIEDYATLLSDQAEVFITKSAIITGTDVLAALADEFKGMDIGTKASERIAAIEADETLSLEWEAEKAYAKIRENAAKKGWKKNIKKLEKLMDKYEGTNVAKRARKKIREANSE